MESIKKIRFDFSAFQFENKLYAVEKGAESGGKKRYLCGVASGTKLDGHQERLTDKAIKSIQDQANSGDILLFAGKHDVNFFDDIGILAKSEVLQNGDWYCEFRLYDQGDGVGASTLERADKVWKQSLGIAPYGRARKRGFSIEGVIPDNGIVQMSEGGKRVIDDVKLEGVVLVNNPAYLPSIAHSICKALGEEPPAVVRKNIKNSLLVGIERENAMQTYYQKRYQIQENLEEQIETIMCSTEDQDTKKEKLSVLYNEYKELMIPLILGVQSVYEEAETIVEPSLMRQPNYTTKVKIFKDMLSQLDSVEKKLKEEL